MVHSVQAGQEQKKTLKTLFVATIFIAFSGIAFAQETKNSCGYEQDIIAYTNNVIEFRPIDETEVSRKYGAIAAYLFAKYSDLPVPGENELYRQIDGLDIDHASDLYGAHQIFTASDADANATINEVLAEEISANNRQSFAILRAALLRGQGRYVLKSEQTRELFIKALGAPHFLAFLVADQDVGTRQALANGFETIGKFSHAMAILQTMPSLAPLSDFIERYKDLAYFDNDIYDGTGGYETGLEFALLNNYELEYQNIILPEDHLYRDLALAKILRGEQQFRLIKVLSTLFNRTNNLDGLADFSTMLTDAISSHALNPNRRTFLALGAYLEYFSDIEPDMLQALAQLRQPYLQYDSTLALAQDQSAAFGFAAFIKDEQALRSQPAFLRGDFDFAAWDATARVIKRGDPTSIGAKFHENPRITAELLFATDRHSQLASLLLESNSQYSLPGFSEVFAVRLDLRCAGYLNAPMSTMRWNIPMFRFGEFPATGG